MSTPMGTPSRAPRGGDAGIAPETKYMSYICGGFVIF